MKPWTVIAAAVLGGSLIWAGTATACSCVRPDAGTFKHADGAIVAKLLRVEPIGDGRNSTYVYRVREAFKKRDRFESGQIRRIKSSSYGASCGIEEPVGSTHGLFLYRSAGRWRSNLCLTTSTQRMRRIAAKVRDGQQRSAPEVGPGGGCSSV